MEEINQNKSDKEFRLSSWAVNNRTTVFVILALIFLAGISAYRSMPAEAFPEVVTPEIYVGTPYPGNSPLDIEKLITRPLEKEINAISGIDEINSTSVQGYSTIQVKFNFDVTPDEALRKVKDKVDVAKSDPDFPSDLPADPNVFEMNFAELVPILNINLSGDFTPDQLKEYAEYLEDRIEGLPEISEVNIRGVDDKEVRVQLDMQKLAALELSFNDVAGALQQENVSVSGGDLLVDGYRRNVRINGEYSSMEEIENTIVKNEKADVVYLKDIATVEFSEVEKESYAREYQQPVVMLDVKKRAGENLIIASDKIEQILADAQATVFPSNLEISVTNDQSDQTRNQIAELENSIIFGVLLVVLVLMFFLGLRNALFVGIAIPTSMLLSFMILNAMGITLNTMVLFSLVLALGMLVDNGIVTVENMHRLMSEGLSPIRAAKRGAGEVALAIIASTATTVAAFIPLAFWPGLMGEFMKYLPMTLIIVFEFIALCGPGDQSGSCLGVHEGGGRRAQSGQTPPQCGLVHRPGHPVHFPDASSCTIHGLGRQPFHRGRTGHSAQSLCTPTLCGMVPNGSYSSCGEPLSAPFAHGAPRPKAISLLRRCCTHAHVEFHACGRLPAQDTVLPGEPAEPGQCLHRNAHRYRYRGHGSDHQRNRRSGFADAGQIR